MGGNIVVSSNGQAFVYRRNVSVGNLMKSETARRGDLAEVRIVRLEQVGKSEMSAEEKYLAGGAFMAMLPRPVTLYASAATKQAIRDRLLKSANADACAEFDAGRGRESDILAALGAVEKAEAGEPMGRDEEGNAIVGLEPMRKSPDLGLFDLGRRRDGREIVRKAYESAGSDGAVSLREAAEELDRLCARMEGR